MLDNNFLFGLGTRIIHQREALLQLRIKIVDCQGREAFIVEEASWGFITMILSLLADWEGMVAD